MSEAEKSVNLSPRLKKIAEYAAGSTCLCDVGTDHGYIPVYMIKNELCRKAYAADIGAAPLSRAKDFIKSNFLEEKIETVLSDGLKEIPKDYDCVVIAGMGGEMIVKILSETPVDERVTLVLQPMTDAPLVREFLYKNGFGILDEDIVKERGNKFYFIIKSKKIPEQSGFSFSETLMSKPLQAKNTPEKREFLQKEILKYKKILSSISHAQTVPDEEKQCIINIISEMKNFESKKHS